MILQSITIVETLSPLFRNLALMYSKSHFPIHVNADMYSKNLFAMNKE